MIWGGTGMRKIVAGSPSLVSVEARIIAICVGCVAIEGRESPRILRRLLCYCACRSLEFYYFCTHMLQRFVDNPPNNNK